MKGIFMLYACFFVLIFAGTSRAQRPLISDSVKLKLKEEEMPVTNRFRTWDIGVNYGMTISNTDISRSKIGEDNSRAFCINATKFLSYSIALRAELLTGKIVGNGSSEGSYKDYNYYSLLNYQFSVMGVFQLGNIAYLKRDPRLAFYGYFGVGVVNSDPYVYKGDDPTAQNYKVDDRKLPVIQTEDYHNESHFIVPLGAGVKFRLNDGISITGEYSYRFTNDDRLDGFNRLLSANDAYTFLNAGVTFHLGKKGKVIQWSNPMRSMVAEVNTMRDSLSLMGQDSDNDGVADFYDRESNTRPGAKVFGDGTAISSDSIYNANYQLNLNKTYVNGGAWLPSIFFEVNSAKIAAKYDETLTSIAVILLDHPEINMDVIGNTDTRASKEYNLKLGQQRAEAVKDRLVKEFNIDPKRLRTRSEGKDDNISKNLNLNRRVDFRIVN
jgi:OOP family OmpA-OmpF porin